MPAPQFTPSEVLEIRHQDSRGRLDVRVWADTKRCSIETIRRIARGDTYRHLPGVKAHPSYGGLHSPAASGPLASGQRPPVPSQASLVPQQAEASPAFVPPLVPPLSDLALTDEPDDEEARASLARLQAALAQPVPGDPQASAAVQLLDELQAAGEASRPPQAGSELG